MSYDNPLVVSYSVGTIGTSSFTRGLKPPKGYKTGRVVDIHADVVTTFTQVTTPGIVEVGTAGDANKYGELNMGAAAAGSGYNYQDYPAGETQATDINTSIDGITQLQLKYTAMTGGTPAGSANLTVVVAWYT
jgi:hypothetical protein